VSELVDGRMDNVNKLGILLGFIVLVGALAAAPMPLMVELQNPARNVVIYPNLLFAVPLILLGVVLLLYGAAAGNRKGLAC
jgi:hypothetical protein